MFRQINYEEVNKIRQEIEKETEKVKELEKKREKLNEEKEKREKENPEKIRKAYLSSNSSQKIAELTREIENANSDYRNTIANLNYEIRESHNKIFQKKDQINRLFGIRF